MEEFVINIQKAMLDEEIPSSIRRLFATIHQQSYITVGDYFRDLRPSELEELGQLVKDSQHPDDVVAETASVYLTLLSVGLVLGEGMEANITEELVEQMFPVAVTYIALECAYRNHLVKVFHKNWTMDTSSPHPVAGPITQ